MGTHRLESTTACSYPLFESYRPTRLVLHQGAKILCDIPFGLFGRSCSFSFNFPDGIHLMKGAIIRAPSVSLTSEQPIIIEQDAHISADGLGNGGIGATSTHGFVGGWHGGVGGSCRGLGGSSVNLATGDGTAPMWDTSDAAGGFGAGVAFSMHRGGQTEQTTCYGGGRILLNTSSYVQLDGAISANGQRPCRLAGSPGAKGTALCPICRSIDDQHTARDACMKGSGAAGGTVLLLSSAPEVALNGSGTVNASGAPADTMACDPTAPRDYISGGGGGGGRIQLPRRASSWNATVTHSWQWPTALPNSLLRW